MGTFDTTALWGAGYEALEHGVALFSATGELVLINTRLRGVAEKSGYLSAGFSLPELLAHFKITDFSEQLNECRTDFSHTACSGSIHLRRITAGVHAGVVMEFREKEGRDLSVNRVYRYNSEILWRIKNRVTAVQNALSFLVDFDSENLQPNQISLLQECRHEIWRLSRYSDNIADLSLLQANELRFRLDQEPVDIGECITESIEEVELYLTCIGRQRTILFEKSTLPYPVRCDRQRLKRILSGMIMNGVYYGNATPVVVTVTDCGSALSIVVSDGGDGLTAQDKVKLFKYPFQSAHAGRVEPSGLGVELFLASAVVKAMGGEIGYRDAVGGGAVFELRFPLVMEE